MKSKVVALFLLAHAIGWCAATVQGVLLQVSPKGVSPDAFLFGSVFAAIAATTAGLSWAVFRRKPWAASVAAAAFVLLGGPATLFGGGLALMGSGAVDSYILPVGLLLLAGGIVHLGLAAVAWSARAEVMS